MNKMQKITSTLTTVGAGVVFSRYAPAMWKSFNKTISKYFGGNKKRNSWKKKKFGTK